MKNVSMSRVFLTLEMLLCFLLPTGGLFVAIAALTGYLPPWGAPISALLLTTSLVGPLGLFLAFRSIVLEHRQVSKGTVLVLCALAAWTFVGNTYFVLTVASPLSELRTIVLMAVLPVVGVAHLVYMGSEERSEPTPA